jgi:hypothetical protein
MPHAERLQLHKSPARSPRFKVLKGKKRHRADYEQRQRIQGRLVRAGYPMIRLRAVRATLEDPFFHARMGESVMTFKHTKPTYVDLGGLENAVDALVAKARKPAAEEAWSFLLLTAKAWAKVRKPIRHPLWGK